MINTRIIIDGTVEDVQIFDSMFEYLDYFGTDITDYILHVISDKMYVVNGFKPVDDSDFHIRGEYEYNGESYVRVNWGENEISLIPSKQVSRELFTIYEKEDENVYHNYNSLIFSSEDEAREKADELNAEEEN